jgi:hypothetical protein
MPDNLESLSDLVETRAAQHGTPQRRLWEWALTAIQDGTLGYEFSKDDFFIRTWRRDHKLHADNRADHKRNADKDLADLVRAKIRDALSFLRLFNLDPCKRWGHFRRLMISAAVFDRWLKEENRTRQFPWQKKRQAGAKSTAVMIRDFIERTYPGGVPASVTNREIANTAHNAGIVGRDRNPVNERTVRRARGGK